MGKSVLDRESDLISYLSDEANVLVSEGIIQGTGENQNTMNPFPPHEWQNAKRVVPRLGEYRILANRFLCNIKQTASSQYLHRGFSHSEQVGSFWMARTIQGTITQFASLRIEKRHAHGIRLH